MMCWSCVRGHDPATARSSVPILSMCRVRRLCPNLGGRLGQHWTERIDAAHVSVGHVDGMLASLAERVGRPRGEALIGIDEARRTRSLPAELAGRASSGAPPESQSQRWRNNQPSLRGDAPSRSPRRTCRPKMVASPLTVSSIPAAISRRRRLLVRCRLTRTRGCAVANPRAVLNPCTSCIGCSCRRPGSDRRCRPWRALGRA